VSCLLATERHTTRLKNKLIHLHTYSLLGKISKNYIDKNIHFYTNNLLNINYMNKYFQIHLQNLPKILLLRDKKITFYTHRTLPIRMCKQ